MLIKLKIFFLVFQTFLNISGHIDHVEFEYDYKNNFKKF